MKICVEKSLNIHFDNFEKIRLLFVLNVKTILL